MLDRPLKISNKDETFTKYCGTFHIPYSNRPKIWRRYIVRYTRDGHNKHENYHEDLISSLDSLPFRGKSKRKVNNKSNVNDFILCLYRV